MNIGDYLNNLNKEKLDSFVDNTDSSIVVKKNVNKQISDTSWIDMVEDCIPYLDNIIRNPRRFIVQEENIVPIEKTKVVTKESIRHLAQHTQLIQDVKEDGSVMPEKLLNVYREETIDLYENRFIYSLITNLYTFVREQMTYEEQSASNKEERSVHYEANTSFDNRTVNIKLDLVSSDRDRQNLTEEMLEERKEKIKHICEVLEDFMASKFMKMMTNATPVRSPIRKTNVILKEQNFIKALELWEYLEKNNIKPITSIDKRTEIVKDADIKTKYDLAFFIDNDAIDMNAASNKSEFNSAIISKLVNDFVFTGDITEKEFKKLMEKEFKEAKKRKDKATNAIRKTIEDFLNDYNTKKKKIISIIK